MIEDIMNLTTNLINHNQSNWTKIERFVLHTVKDENNVPFVQMEGLNRSHTAIFKARVKQSDLGLIFKYPCIYEYNDALLRKWRLKRMDFTNIRDKSYCDLLKFDDVFHIEYDSFEYSDLKRILLSGDTDQIEIRNNGCYNVYSTELLRSMMFEDFEDIGLKIIYQDAPLRLNYQWKMFDIYCLIAPRLEVQEDRYFLRV